MMSTRTASSLRPPPVLLALLVGLIVAGVVVQGAFAFSMGAWGEDLVAAFLSNVPVGGVFTAVGCIVLLRAGWNPTGWLLVAIGAVFAAMPLRDLLPPRYKGWLEVVSVLTLLALFALMTLVFPTGRLPAGRRTWPRVARWAAAGLPLVVALVGMAVPPISLISSSVADFAHLVLGAVLVGGSLSLVIRWRRSTGEERAQFTWVVAALALLVVLLIVATMAGILGAGDGVYALAVPGFLAVPVAFVVAILRYRLYEIDRLVNRTIVYGLTTAGLVAVYAGIVIGLPRVLPVSLDAPVAVASATLAVAGLFRPVTRRVQEVVDRRFYRRRYDAELTVAGFADRLSHEVDLEVLEGELCAVVADTMHPDRVGLWLRRRV